MRCSSSLRSTVYVYFNHYYYYYYYRINTTDRENLSLWDVFKRIVYI